MVRVAAAPVARLRRRGTEAGSRGGRGRKGYGSGSGGSASSLQAGSPLALSGGIPEPIKGDLGDIISANTTPSLPPLVYPPGTQPPPPGRTTGKTPAHVSAP